MGARKERREEENVAGLVRDGSISTFLLYPEHRAQDLDRSDRIGWTRHFSLAGLAGVGMCVCRVSIDGMVWSVRSLYVRDIEERVCLHTLIH